ncbi:uncharacterized protein LOC133292187 [Gastrolobium bilobum]|uniref:uncharacterized protein LOC133292187 n=1 Tax=Gastrolobium bilobum TaxID=150636 RepID=UPI002AAFEC41|nr:uncharacterized protein LOC133292187 [Gastrolobium bilobum]
MGKGGRPPNSVGDLLINRDSKKAKGEMMADLEMHEEPPIVGTMEVEGDGSGPIGGDEAMTGISVEEEVKRDPRKLISYKDQLLSVNGVWDGIPEDDADDWFAQSKQDEIEEEEALKAYEQIGEDDPLNPFYQFDILEKVDQCKRWRKTLIVKLMGKRLGARFLWNRLHKLWNLEGEYRVLDLENDHYMVEFEKPQDYLFVQQQGPWIVADHYLIVQRWRPNFDPYDDRMRKLAVWIKIPGVPREFYTHKDLWRMGNMVGRTLRIDESSLRISGQGQLEEITDRGKFVRICVEIDLNKSLLSKFRIGQRQLYIGYEGLHLICFLCGQYGHRKDQCSMNPVNGKKAEENPEEVTQGNHSAHVHNEAMPTAGIEKSQEVDGFGSWMTVQRRNFKRPSLNLKPKEVPVSKDKLVVAGSDVQSKGCATGSRFGPLEGETEQETTPVASNQVAGANFTKPAGGSNQHSKVQGGKRRRIV